MNSTEEYLEILFYDIYRIYPLPLIVFGSIENSIILYIYFGKKFLKSSTAFYFIYSTLIDTLCLYFGALKRFLEGINEREIRNDSKFFCKFSVYMIYTLIQMSGWLLVLISLDRMIIISMPYFNKYRKRIHQLLAIGAITIIISVSNVYFAVKLKLVKKYDSFICDFEEEIISSILNIYDLLIAVLIPFVIMISTSVLLIIKLHKSKSKVLDSKHSFKTAKHYAITIIGKNLIFLILNLPICIITLEGVISYHSKNDVAMHNLVYALFCILSDLNYSINVILHYSLNRLFRKKFLDIVKNLIINKC